MRLLIEAIKEKLEELGGVAVFVTPNENFLPNRVRLPAVGIKDGSIRRTLGGGGSQEESLDVSMTLWVQLGKPEASIMGDRAAKEMGILEFAEKVHTLLDGELLGIPGMEEAWSASESPSSLVETDRALQIKVITYTYDKEGNRPCTN
jgi:hypothetical protein